MEQREVSFANIRGNASAPAGKPLPNVEGEQQWVLKDGDDRLGEWQQATGLEHWTGNATTQHSACSANFWFLAVMRHVMKDEMWESY
jgi:hypothetical protein